jgi:hypothetical protein
MSRRTSKRMEKATGIGPALFSWPLWLAMSDTAKVFWLHLYASGHARGGCPVGLWKGGPAVMAEECRRDVGTVMLLLHELEQLGAIEYDRDHHVLRLVVLPDRSERPHNGDVLRGWWTKFLWLPACPVRDRHVATLRWLVGTFTRDHEEAWSETFGRIEGAHRVSHVDSAGSGHLVHRVGHGVAHRQGEGEVVGSSDSGSEIPLSLLPGDHVARACDPPPVDDPTLAEVVNLAHKSFERHGAKRAGGR